MVVHLRSRGQCCELLMDSRCEKKEEAIFLDAGFRQSVSAVCSALIFLIFSKMILMFFVQNSEFLLLAAVVQESECTLFHETHVNRHELP